MGPRSTPTAKLCRIIHVWGTSLRVESHKTFSAPLMSSKSSPLVSFPPGHLQSLLLASVQRLSSTGPALAGAFLSILAFPALDGHSLKS